MSVHSMAEFDSMISRARRIFAAKRAGRPVGADPDSERSRSPWIDLKISPRTYYRRKAAEAAKADPAPLQHAAHVVAWISLSGIQKLEHRALTRRCIAAGVTRRASRMSIIDLYLAALGASEQAQATL